jgi:hypothetical protein
VGRKRKIERGKVRMIAKGRVRGKGMQIQRGRDREE